MIKNNFFRCLNCRTFCDNWIGVLNKKNLFSWFNDKTSYDNGIVLLENDKSEIFTDFSLSFNAPNFEKFVAMIEGSIIRPREDSTLRTDSINKFIDDLKVVMERRSDIPIKLLKSGSYYDRTKVTVKKSGIMLVALKIYFYVYTNVFICDNTTTQVCNDAIYILLGSKRGLQIFTK